jgi:hypothetical protein
MRRTCDMQSVSYLIDKAGDQAASIRLPDSVHHAGIDGRPKRGELNIAHA